MEFIISFLSEWGYLALFICMALENMNIPIPSEIILGFAGFLVSQGVFSFWPTILIGTLAGLIGSLASYYMGYKGGRDMILRHTQKGGMGAKKMIAAKNWFETYGGIAVSGEGKAVSVVTLTRAAGIPRSDFDGLEAAVVNGVRVPIASEVQVYNTETGQWTTLEDAKSFASSFTVYYDKSPSSGGQIRVILTE